MFLMLVNFFHQENPKCVIRRKIKSLPISMGKVDKRPRNFIYSRGSRNSFHVKSNSGKSSISTSLFDQSKKVSGGRDSGNVGERSNQKSQSMSGPVSKQFISGGEERWGEQTSDQPQTSKYVLALRTLQDGKFNSLEKCFTKRRLHVQIGHEGRLLLHTTRQTLQEIHKVHVLRQPIRIHLPLLWLRSSTPNIYKALEGADRPFTENQHKDHNLFRRHAPDESNNRGVINEQGHCDFSVATPRVCDKSEKINPGSETGDRVFRINSKFQGHDSIINSRKNEENYISLCGYVHGPPSVSIRSNEADRETVLNNPGSSTCSVAIQVLTGEPGSSTTTVSRLSPGNRVGLESQRGITLVDRKPGNIQRQTNNTREISTANSDRCIKGRLGCLRKGSTNRGSLELTGVQSAHKHSGANCGEICSSVVLKNVQQHQLYPFSNRQHDSFVIPTQDGRDKMLSDDRTSKGDLVISPSGVDHNYCRVPPQCHELQSRLGVTKHNGQLRLEVKRDNIPTNLSETGVPKHRPICIQNKQPTPKLFFMETRPLQPGNGCNTTGLDRKIPICVSPILHDKSGTKQSQEGKSGTNDNNNSSMASSALVLSTPGDVNSQPNLNSTTVRSANKLDGSKTPISTEKETATGGMVSFRERLKSSGLSESARNLVSHSRREGTLANYESSWRLWSSWCREQSIDPVRCPLNHILNYLSMLFDKGLAYRTINNHRSAISAYHEHVDGMPVGKNHLVCSLLTGVFNGRPPKPRLTYVWAVTDVLEYFKNLGDSVNLSNKDLTLKLTMLLALTSASRASGIHHLDIRYMVKGPDRYIFSFGKLYKAWQRGKAPPEVTYYSYPHNKILCVIDTLEEYLSRSEKWRGDKDNRKTQLLLVITVITHELILYK